MVGTVSSTSGGSPPILRLARCTGVLIGSGLVVRLPGGVCNICDGYPTPPPVVKSFQAYLGALLVAEGLALARRICWDWLSSGEDDDGDAPVDLRHQGGIGQELFDTYVLI